MPRKIKIALIFRNDAQITTLEEIRANFDIEALIWYFCNGGLLKFLKTRGYDEYARKTSPSTRMIWKN